MRGYAEEHRKALARALAEGRPLLCPICSAALTQQRVPPPAGVAYVRRRVWVLCPGCHLATSLDLPDDALPD